MSMQFDQVQFVIIQEENQHQRIDNFLFRLMKGVPKSKVYRILRKGEVRVNKKRVKPEYKLQVSDSVRIPPVRVDEVSKPNLKANKFDYLKQAILFEDERLLIINKPSGLAVHGGSGLHFGLIEALRAMRPDQQFMELVHRIDRDTSGCIVIAKKRSALRHLHEQLRQNSVDKTYHAIVSGVWPKKLTRISAKLYKNQLQSGERMVFVDDRGKESETKYKLLRSFAEASLIEAKPITGRTHQIRVHCQYAGYEIANDTKYGDDVFSKGIQALGCKRLCLHAKKITFTHPLSDEKMTVEAPFDDHLNKLIHRLAAQIK